MAQPNPDNASHTDILVVDPDTAIGEGMQLLFKTAGFAAHVVVDAAHAENAVQTLSPRCLVITAELPVLTGIELLTQLRSQGITTPAIIIASRGDVPTAVAAMRAGAIDFLEKPLIDARLLQAVRRIMQKSYTQSISANKAPF